MPSLTTFVEHGVQVEIVLEGDDQDSFILAATFTPMQPGFHLYANDLPRGGLSGVGRPTRFDFLSGQEVWASGPLSVSAAPINETAEGFDRPFPVYPAGPVTLRQPIQFTEITDWANVELAITFMACSDQGACLPPVENKRILMTISRSGLVQHLGGLLPETHDTGSSSSLGYDPRSNAFRDLDQARAEATSSGKHILLEVGGDWCIWCHKLDHFFEANPDVAQFLDQHFVMLKVHYSKAIPNTAFLSQFPPVAGYPHIFVLDGQGTLLHSENTGDLEWGDHHDREKVLTFLKAWAVSVP